MTIDEFNNKKFKAGQFVSILFYNGTSRNVQLSKGYAYHGYDAQESYLGGPGRKESSPKIVIIDPDKPQGSGISLEEVADVQSIN